MNPDSLRAARKSLGLSQTRMAAALEIGRRTYQRLEAGDAQIRKGTWLIVEDLLKAEKTRSPCKC